MTIPRQFIEAVVTKQKLLDYIEVLPKNSAIDMNNSKSCLLARYLNHVFQGLTTVEVQLNFIYVFSRIGSFPIPEWFQNFQEQLLFESQRRSSIYVAEELIELLQNMA